MKKYLSGFVAFLVVVLGMSLTACSGGGSSSGASGISYSGNSSPAEIDGDNAQEIGEVAGESVRRAVGADSLPSGVAIDPVISQQEIRAIISDTVSASLGYTPSAANVVIDVSEDVCSSGSATVGYPESYLGVGYLEMKLSYTNCIVEGILFDGVVEATFDDLEDPNAAFSFHYIDFLVQDGMGESVVLNMLVECENQLSCFVSSDFVGSDGRVHRVSEFNVTGNDGDGYNGTASVYHSVYGKVSITITNVTYGACGTMPDGGSIAFESVDSSGTIFFAGDCTQTGTWTNDTSGTSGSF